MKQKKHILVAICGGIAAYKTAELVRLLVKNGCLVRVIMTVAATKFVGALTFQALSGTPVQTEILDVEAENAMGHIELARWAEQVIIAPATANILAKLAHGLADDLLSTVILATQAPVFIAPAMNSVMWHQPVTQDNVGKLQAYGFKIIAPEAGEQACGEFGVGRMAEAETILQQLLNTSSVVALPLTGLKILISAGATREPLDPVRYLTNRSSGKMGYALAQAAVEQGAQVVLVSGVVNLVAAAGIQVVQVETAAQMYQAVMACAETQDIYIGAAAVADYTPANINSQKIKKHADDMSLQLVKTQDILAAVANLKSCPFVVGFAAETDALEAYAIDKLVRKKLDMIAANLVGQKQGGFDSDENALKVFWQDGQQEFVMQDKQMLAKLLLNLIIERLNAKNTT